MPDAVSMLIRPFAPADTEPVIDLWRRCGLTRPWNDARCDIDRKLTVQPELFLVGEVDSGIVATAMAGYDGHRGWVNYLAVEPDHRRSGLAGQLIAVVEAELRLRGCPKVSLQVREGNEQAIGFYRSLGTPTTGPSSWASG
ncbi:MAG TPA: GNAT family acetyltransferase [Nakamurella sp.]|jgi:ribosomal protein S18 acetylase RimI-like enzyme